MRTQPRVLAFFGLLALSIVGIAVALVTALVNQDADAPSPSASAVQRFEETLRGEKNVVVFRALKADAPAGQGQLAISAIDQLGARTLGSMRCDRSYFAGGHGICVTRSRKFAEGYEAHLFDSRLRVDAAIRLDGIPSRARVSPDGRLGAVTMFVTGHSYADAGEFSTQTTLLDIRAGRVITDLEQFTVMHGQRRITAVDVNFWGVTFSPVESDHFYATLATGGKTYLIEGSVRDRSARVLHTNVECPSVSPDGTRIAYKHRERTGEWRLSVLDLATMRVTPLAETRNVDDQAEWLDDNQVLYGLEGAIWSVRADGTGAPQLYLPDADSPAVVHR